MRKLLLPLVLAGLCAAQSPPAVPDWVSVERDIAYDQYPQTVLDLMQSTRHTGDKRPGVLVIHGGGWTGGSRDGMLRHCLRYLENGFVVANVGYRLAKDAPAPAAVSDVLAAADWFSKNAKRYGVDNNRIVVTGQSAGGHLALMVGLATKRAQLGPTSKIAAVINVYGITDVLDVTNGANQRDWAVTWVPDQPGRIDLARRVSPVTYTRKDAPPILTIHGALDTVVPYEQATNLTRLLVQAGADAQLYPVATGEHGFPDPVWDEVYAKVFDFLERRGIR